MVLLSKIRRVLLIGASLTIGTVALSVDVPTAEADQYGFTCFVPAQGFCIIEDTPWRHIYKVNARYPGDGELVIGVGLAEEGVGPWGQARNRSNNSSLVTLDTGNESALFRAVLYNYSNNGHTINGTYYWQPTCSPKGCV